jgi:hypothetical protein
VMIRLLSLLLNLESEPREPSLSSEASPNLHVEERWCQSMCASLYPAR